MSTRVFLRVTVLVRSLVSSSNAEVTALPCPAPWFGAGGLNAEVGSGKPALIMLFTDLGGGDYEFTFPPHEKKSATWSIRFVASTSLRWKDC